MIVIDSSALVAILDHEPECTSFFDVIAAADRRLVSATTLQETGQIAFSRRGAQGLYDLEKLLTLIGAEIVAHDGELARLAIETSKRFGKGIHAKARLNFCDCAAYALARSFDAPLLFKGMTSMRRISK